MRSKISIAGHPIHPMLVGFPIAFYAAALVGFISYQVNGDAFWFRLAFVANIAGVVMAAIAMIPGFLDWNLSIPKGTEAKRTGLIHMSFNALAIVLFAVNVWMQSGQWQLAAPNAGGAVFLSVFGLISTLAAGFYGWSLVQNHHVGIIEPTDSNLKETIAPKSGYASSKDRNFSGILRS